MAEFGCIRKKIHKVLKMSKKYFRIPLSSDIFKLGCGKACDYVIRESDMGSKKLLTAVSKCQCEIVKENQTAFIIDKTGPW